jgi:acyl carrier protein
MVTNQEGEPIVTEQEVLQHIEKLVHTALSDKGEKPGPVDASTELLSGDLGIDSLDLATMVRELEEIVGHDPFKDGFVDFRTAGELAKLYAR